MSEPLRNGRNCTTPCHGQLWLDPAFQVAAVASTRGHSLMMHLLTWRVQSN